MYQRNRDLNMGFNCIGPHIHRFFFNKYIVQYYMICGWLNPQMWNHGYGGQTVKLHVDFQLLAGWWEECVLVPLTPNLPTLVKP